MEWTREKVEFIRLRRSEGLSISKIAQEMRVGRGAIVGKLDRLGLCVKKARGGEGPRRVRVARAAPARAPAILKPPNLPPRARAVLPPALIAAPEVSVPLHRLGLRRAILSLKAGGCRWPFGDPKRDDFHFCCTPVSQGSYCAEHYARSVRA